MVYQQLHCWLAYSDLQLCKDLLLYQHQAVDSQFQMLLSKHLVAIFGILL